MSTVPPVLAHARSPDLVDLLWCTARLWFQSSPTPVQIQPTRWLSGIPRAVIVFRILHPTLASTRWPCSVRLRIAGPMMAL